MKDVNAQHKYLREGHPHSHMLETEQGTHTQTHKHTYTHTRRPDKPQGHSTDIMPKLKICTTEAFKQYDTLSGPNKILILTDSKP